jgi:hypothetical protein
MSILQQTINVLYRHPKGKIRQIQRQGGLWNTWQITRARREMEKAAQTLRVHVEDTGITPYEVHFLTGKKYWYQTIFCMYSLQKTTTLPFHFHLYDDGSFDKSLIQQIKKQAPLTTIHTLGAIEERLNNVIPKSEFPFLWHKRKVYPHIKKLTDIHAGTKGWKLVLDSDMLFLRAPLTLIEWLQQPEIPFFIQEEGNFYGYSKELMETLCQRKIRDCINVGVIGLKSEEIDWLELITWAEELEKTEGASYFLEQALTAMLLGDTPSIAGKRSEYIVNPSRDDVENKNGTLHHYVDLSKEWYFKKAWKELLKK